MRGKSMTTLIVLEKDTVLSSDNPKTRLLYNMLSYDDILRDNDKNYYTVQYCTDGMKLCDVETGEVKGYSELFIDGEQYTVVKARGKKRRVVELEEVDFYFKELMLALPAITSTSLIVEDMKILRLFFTENYRDYIHKNNAYSKDSVYAENNMVFQDDLFEYFKKAYDTSRCWTASIESIIKNNEVTVSVAVENELTFNEFRKLFSLMVIEDVLEELEMLLGNNGEKYYSQEFASFFEDEDYYHLAELNKQIDSLSEG